MKTNQFNFPVGSVDGLRALQKNPKRSYLLVQNQDAAATLYIAFGRKNETAIWGIVILPGQYFERHGCSSTPSEEMWLVGSAATNSIHIVEGTDDAHK